MTALFRIVYAAHASGTHHKLALDALQSLAIADAEPWRRLFLKHAGVYLEGSKAPDVSFKDFKNHVLHVRDNFWGGAPEKAVAWYEHTVTALKAGRWAEAVYAAGVLSHYFTDPVHPFHTAQTEAENSLHRAVEWSISRSYGRLRKIGEVKFASLDVALPDGEHWLKDAVIANAEFANRYYEKLIAHYDINVGVVHPEEGLDDIGQLAVAELLIYAAKKFARVIERAISDSRAQAPNVALSIDTVLATLAVPRKWLVRRLDDAADRRLVESQYDELRATGRVDATLNADDRAIRDLFEREVMAPRQAAASIKRDARLPAGDPADARRAIRLVAAADNPVKPAADAGGLITSSGEARSTSQTAAQASPSGATRTAMASTLPAQVERQSTSATAPTRQAVKEPSRRPYLSMDDDLERAPSIGPVTARRFANVGVATVADFLAADVAVMEHNLGLSHFDAATLEEWQHQARLVIAVPGLRGTHAQLLTGAGYISAQHVATADAGQLCADVLAFAATPDGRRVLREGHAPDIEKIRGWVTAAQQAVAA